MIAPKGYLGIFWAIGELWDTLGGYSALVGLVGFLCGMATIIQRVSRGYLGLGVCSGALLGVIRG